jgi:hypothetical protein
MCSRGVRAAGGRISHNVVVTPAISGRDAGNATERGLHGRLVLNKVHGVFNRRAELASPMRPDSDPILANPRASMFYSQSFSSSGPPLDSINFRGKDGEVGILS